MNTIRLHDLDFEPYLTAEAIDERVGELARRIQADYTGKDPVMLIVLKGAFIFAADLVRKLVMPLEIDFVKVSSYEGTASSGKLDEQLRWHIPLIGRHVIIVEDIVDKGHTLAYLRREILREQPASLEVACLLFKPEAYGYAEEVRYHGFAIPNAFVVGYGLDYDQLGRHLDTIYKVKG